MFARTLSKQAWHPRPLVSAHGFVAMPWIEGTPLRVRDGLSPEWVHRLGAYIVASATEPLTPKEDAEACLRLVELLAVNSREALGPAAETLARCWTACGSNPGGCPSAGDGRMAPHEWVRTPDGAIFKTVSDGHESDHTHPGRQPVYWDIAGACTEWRLRPPAIQSLVRTIETSGIPVDRHALHVHRCAYTAFRMGQMALCAELPSVDAGDSRRFHAAFQDARRSLEGLLGSEPV